MNNKKPNMTRETLPPVLMTEHEAAQYLSVSRSFLAKGRMEGGDRTPPFVKLGKAVRYRLAELDAWLDRHVRTNTLYS